VIAINTVLQYDAACDKAAVNGKILTLQVNVSSTGSFGLML